MLQKDKGEVSYTVLVVDDNPMNIELLDDILNEEYTVKCATNGEKALEIAFSKNPPDLILLDVMMPKMDGFEVCRQLKENIDTRAIPVIFVTAKNEIEDESTGFELGAVDYIRKPISLPIVQARVKTHLSLFDQNRFLETKVKERTIELHKTRLEIIHKLGRAAEYKDNETGMHVIRMSKYCEKLALAYGLSEAESELILNAAPMHDIGKIGTPDSILQKPGKLTPEEWEIMKRHPLDGANIIGEHQNDLMNAARIVALTHHEKWDGTGYPYQLKEEDIHLYGRLIAIADVFDALTSKRPYKKAWPINETLEFLQGQRGKHFDPDIVDALIKTLPEILVIKEKYKED